MAFDWGNAFRGGASGAAAGSSFGPWGTAIGGGVGALSGFFGNNEEEETNKLLDQIPDQLKQYLMPYITAGQGALGKASGAYDELLKDPNALISRIGAGYKQSPGYQWRLNQGEQGITNAAAAGGMAGTGQHQQQAGELAENLANQDYNNYMTNALGLYGKGLEGEQNIANWGRESGGDLGTSLANLLQGKAGLNYARGANKNQMNSDLASSIMAYLGKNSGSIKRKRGDNMPVFNFNSQAFPLLTPQQTSPLGGVLSDAIAKRLKMAETEKQEALLPYVGQTAAAQLTGLQQQNQWNPKIWQSEIGLRGIQGELAKQDILQKKLDYDKAKQVRDLFAKLGQNNSGQLQNSPNPSAISNQSMPNINIPQIPSSQLSAPQKQDLSSNLAQILATQQKGLEETPSIPEIPAIGQYLQQQQAQSPMQTQDTQTIEGQQNPVQVINPGRTELSNMDEQYEKNPLIRSELEKYGLKKKTEIKFDNKTGQTRIITTYPSGKITMQVSGLGNVANGIPLTNNQVTKHQNVVSSVDVALPILEKIKDLKGFSAYPLSSLGIPSVFGNKQATYDGLVNQVLDSLIGAFGMPKTNEGLNSVRNQLEIRHLETPTHYRERLGKLIEELKHRKDYSANEVKKSNKIQPVGRSDSSSNDESYSSNDWEPANEQ